MSDKLQFVVSLVSIRVETNSANDKLKFVGLLLLRHAHLDAILLQFSLEDFPDSGIFVLVFDQVSALARAGLAQAMRSSTSAERTRKPFAVSAPSRCDVTRRVMTGVEVLVEPAIGRHKQTSFDPINPLPMIGNARPAAEARSINLRRETVPVNRSSKSSFIIFS